MQDKHNNVGRYCDVVGVDAPRRSWRVESPREDRGGNTTYWLVNVITGRRMICGLENMSNLW
jgi:hypothetical protein